MSLLKSSCEQHGFGKRSTPHISNDTGVSLVTPAPVSAPLTELLRSGARRLIEAEVSAEFEPVDAMQTRLAERRHGLHAPDSVLCSGWPVVHVEPHPGADFPRTRPRYE